MLLHSGSSLTRSLGYAAGGPNSGSASSGFGLACVAGSASAALVARLSLSTIALDVPGGATMPVQELAVKPGTPFSAMVGTSGRSASRFGDGVPNVRHFSSRHWRNRIAQGVTAE